MNIYVTYLCELQTISLKCIPRNELTKLKSMNRFKTPDTVLVLIFQAHFMTTSPFFSLKEYPIYFKFIYVFIYLFFAMLGLRFCARAFSSCGKRGPLFIAVRGPLTIAASLVAEHRLQMRRLSNCGSRA